MTESKMPRGKAFKSEEIKSQVPRVLLGLNPGINRQLNVQLQMLDVLRDKASRTGDQRRQRFVIDFENRKARSDRLYSRLIKMDDETQKAVNEIRARKGSDERARGERKRMVMGSKSKLNDMDAFGEDLRSSPTFLANQEPVSGLIGVEHSGDSIFGTAVLSSRRSSLRSSIITGMEGGRADSPGPQHTENPLADIAIQSPSRRSSVSSAVTMPEVLVTRPEKDKDATSRTVEAYGGQEEVLENKNVADKDGNGKKIVSLLPAPTPTRFVGRMHAVLSSGQERRKPSVSSDIPETIQEDQTLQTEPLDLAEDDALETEKDVATTDSSNAGGRRKFSSDAARNAKASGTASMASKVGSTSDRGSIGDEDSPPSSRKASWKAVRRISNGHGVDSRQCIDAGVATPNGKRTVVASWARPKSKYGEVTSLALSGLSTGPSPKHGRKRGTLASRMQKLTKQGSIAASRDVTRVKPTALQSATKMMGLFLKSHKKRTEEEILAAFGADDESDSDVEDERKGEEHFGNEKQHPDDVKSGGIGELIGVMGARNMKSVDEDAAGNHVSLTALSLGTSKLVGKLTTMSKQKVSPADVKLEELTTSWMTGVPTSIRFLGKSFLSAPRGPGGIIVTDSPPQSSRRLSVAQPDFTPTTNMLALLAKANVKIKSQITHKSEGGGEGGTKDRLDSAREFSKFRRRSKIGSGLVTPVSSTSLRSSVAKPGGKEQPQPSEALGLDAEEGTKKLVDSLLTVRATSIPRWNEHKDIKEDREREPFYFAPTQPQSGA